MKCKHCGSEDYPSNVFNDVCTFCVDIENPETVYQMYKDAGYYDPIECDNCNKTVHRYLYSAHQSQCK